MCVMKWWNVDGGQIDDGSTYAGEKFRGLHYFIREDIQNSIDAKLANEKPVRVVIDLRKVETENLPDEVGLQHIFSERLTCQSEGAAKQKLEEIKNSFHKDSVWVLRFSDFNTKGLKFDPDDDNSSWHTLVMSLNKTSKSGNEGGSFGLGKSVNLANSSRKQVFYRSVSAIDNSCAFQGLAFLASAARKANDGKKRYFSAYVRYGVTDETPKTSPHSFLSFEDRNEAGTDIFVVDPVKITTGFKDEAGQLNELGCQLICDVICNFAVSLKQGLLAFDLQENGESICTLASSEDVLQFLNSPSFNNCHDLQRNKAKEVNFFKNYFLNQVQTEKIVIDGTEIGTLSFTLDDEFGNFPYGCREPGMYIEPWKEKIRPGTKYQFILQVTEVSAAKLLRELESPEHTEWDHSSGRGSDKAIEFHKALRMRVSHVLKEFAKKAGEEIIAVRNLDVLKSQGDTDLEITDLKLKPQPVQIPKPIVVKPSKPKKAKARVKRSISPETENVDDEGVGGSAGGQKGSHIGKQPGTGNPAGTAGTVGNQEGQEQGEAMDQGADEKKPVLIHVDADFLAVSPSLGKYFLRFTPPKKAKKIRIELTYAGEQEDGDVSVEEVISSKNCSAKIMNHILEVEPQNTGTVTVMFKTVEKDFATLVGEFYVI